MVEKINDPKTSTNPGQRMRFLTGTQDRPLPP